MSTSIPILPFRMGLEALVESYAFWRPSLRTLTFEDIPGIPKQGKMQSLLGHIDSQFLTGSLGTAKLHLSSWASTMATSSPTSSCDRIHLFSVRNGDGDQKNGSCGHTLSLACFRLFIYFRTFTSPLNLLWKLELDCGLLCQAHLTGNGQCRSVFALPCQLLSSLPAAEWPLGRVRLLDLCCGGQAPSADFPGLASQRCPKFRLVFPRRELHANG